jgi:tRNA(adenine34) deaminase
MQEVDAVMMQAALQEARLAMARGEVPVGAVVVHDGMIIARAHNGREGLQDPTAHAEILALRCASLALGRWRLTGCTLYVTLEPCAMCAGAMVLARIDRLAFGCRDPKAGACGSIVDLVRDPRLNHRIEVTSGALEAECGQILTEFFTQRRSKRRLGDKAEVVEI